MKHRQFQFRGAAALVLLVTIASSARGFSIGHKNCCSKPARLMNDFIRVAVPSKTALRSTSNDDDDGTTNNEPAAVEETTSSTSEEDLSLLDKINKFLDTPILDANNRSDQGALAETLKEFVRDEPEVAQVTFSVVVVAIMVIATRLVLSS